MSTDSETSIHRIYLLTVWRGSNENWRFQIEDPRSGKRNGFASVQALVDGLLERVIKESGSADHPDDLSSASSPSR